MINKAIIALFSCAVIFKNSVFPGFYSVFSLLSKMRSLILEIRFFPYKGILPALWKFLTLIGYVTFIII